METFVRIIQQGSDALAHTAEDEASMKGYLIKFSPGGGFGGGTVKKYYYKLCGTTLLQYATEDDEKPCSSHAVRFAVAEPRCMAEEDDKWSFVARFRVYTGTKIVIFEAENEQILQEWIHALYAELKRTISFDELETKCIAAKKLEPYLDLQREHEAKIRDEILNGDGKIFAEKNVKESSGATKRGHLRVRKRGSNSWKKSYYAISDGVLHCIKGYDGANKNSVSKHRGVSLSHSRVSLSKKHLEKNIFVIKLVTPNETLHLAARHREDLYSWIEALDAQADVPCNALEAATKIISATDRVGEWTNSEEFFSSIQGRKCAKAFLASVGKSALYAFIKDCRDFFRVVDSGDASHALISRMASRLFATYFSGGLQSSLGWISPFCDDVAKAYQDKDFAAAFEGVFEAAKRRFDKMIPAIVKSKEFKRLLEVVQSAEEKAERFGDKDVFFQTYGASSSLHRLSKSVLTVGRDQSNDICLDDAYASRFQCKIERDCEGRYVIIDLGGASRTKVNGSRIVKHGLRSSDTIRLGKTKAKITTKPLIEDDLDLDIF